MQMNAQTWSTEQLMTATGIGVVMGYHPNAEGGRTNLPKPNAADLWIAEHPLPLTSSYNVLLGSEPEYTSCHGAFIGTVDYIWFTPEVRQQPHT